MGQNRRDFLKTTTAGAGWAMLGGCASTIESCRQAIENRPVRRNIASLGTSHPIIDAYQAAVRAMKALPLSDRRNWTNQARIHNDFCPHGNWLFLPWHRCYLLYFERICRQLSGMEDFALPYWNWSTNPQIPAVFWGGPNNPLFDGTRTATPSTTASAASVGPLVVGSILDEPNFLLFASGSIPASGSQRQFSNYGRLEGTPHNYIHPFVGGNMSNFMSPLDPVFWLHHNMVERMWVHWNLVRQHPNTDDRAWLDREFTEFCDENGNPVSVTVALSLLFPILSYRYDDEVDDPSLGIAAGVLTEEQAAQDRSMWMRLNEESRAARDEGAARARRGARVELEVLERVSTSEPITVAIGQPTTLQLSVEAPILALAAMADLRKLLWFEGVRLDFTTDFSVWVFINHPDAGPETSPDDPRFVGAFSSFHPEHGEENAAVGRFVLDAGPVLERLGLQAGPVDVTLVLVPFPGRLPMTRVLELRQVELQIARDVIEVSAR